MVVRRTLARVVVELDGQRCSETWTCATRRCSAASSAAARKLLDAGSEPVVLRAVAEPDARPLRLRGTTLVQHLRQRAKLALRTPGTDRVIHGSLRREREFALRWKLVADASRAGGRRLEAVSPHWLREALG